MKKITTIVCMAALVLTASLHAQTPEQDYRKTLSKLDQGGITLNYLNYKAVEQIFTSFWDQCVAPLQIIKSNQDAAKVVAIGKNIYQVSGLNGIRAIGSSVKFNYRFYTGKTFIYAPAAGQKGLIWDFTPAARDIKPMTRLLPADAFYSFGSYLTAKKGYESLLAIARQLGKDIPEVRKGYQEFMQMQKAQNMDLAAFADSIEFIVGYAANTKGAAPMIPGLTDFALILKTKNDSIYKTLLTSVPPDSVKNGAIVFPGTPFAIFQYKNHLFATNNVQKVKALIDGRGAAGLSSSQLTGHATAFCSVTPEFGTFLRNLIPLIGNKEPDLNLFINNLISYLALDKGMVCLMNRTQDGILFTCASMSPVIPMLANSSNMSVVATVPTLAGMLLPALHSAREKGKSVHCMNQLKQIATGIFMYANDHDDRLPPDLQTIKKNYKVDTTCPVSRKEYLYFPVKTKMTQIKTPSLRITVMDPPGVHENGFAVAFVDGHVEMIRGKFRTAEAQVRAVIQKYPNTPDQAEILRIAREWDKKN